MVDLHEPAAHPWCLEFSNTVGRHTPDNPEKLRTYEDLVMWAQQVGIISEQEKPGLVEQAHLQPQESANVLEQAIALRESIFRLFSSVAAGGSAGEEDLALLNQNLTRALPHLRLVSTPQGLGWKWQDLETTLEGLLWPIARSAAELLSSDQLSRVRECSSPTCNWLFMDLSKNHSRRWCEMNSCGNKAKARRYYQRHKTMPSEPS